MTRSQAYAVERSRERNVPIVLFDEAEVAMVMHDPTLFPVVSGRRPKGWAHVRSINFNPTSVDFVDASEAIVNLVTKARETYGFALVGVTDDKLQLGVFQKTAPDAEVIEEPFIGQVRQPIAL